MAPEWRNGHRSLLVDGELAGPVLGLTTTQPHEVYRTLLEAAAIGTRRIIQAFEESGVPGREIVVAGGLPRNAFLMQLSADVTERPSSVIGSEQGAGPRCGDLRCGAAGAYPDTRAASAATGRVHRVVCVPAEGRAAAHNALCVEHQRLTATPGRRTPWC